ncbi:MAG TPA: MFS transporter [Candidatus Paceibacterota bacterium]|nr:MFS transporter [Candidatus Paceibacterota bacterium]
MPIRLVNKAIRILLLFLFVVNTASALWGPLFAVFVTGHIAGATLATVGIMAAIYSVTKSVIQLSVARRLDKRPGESDDFAAILLGSLLSTFASFTILGVNKIWQIVFLQILWGIADAFTMAAFYAIFSHHIDRESEGFEWSLFSVGGITVAAALGGLVGGLMAQVYGFPAIFITSGILNAIGFILLLSLYPHIKILRKSEDYKALKDPLE